MKIVHCAHLFPPARGGIEHHTLHLARSLALLGEDVTVLTSRLPDTPAEETKDGVRIKRYFSIKLPKFSAARFIPLLCLRLWNENADVYCSHGYGSPMPFFTALAALLRGKPFVFTLHGYPKQKGLGKVFQTLYKWLAASFFLRVAKKVIVVSRLSMDDIKGEVDAKKLVYVPNGIDAQAFQCGDFTKNNRITYIGRLDKDKGIDMLVRAFAKIKEKQSKQKNAPEPALELAIVGPDEGWRKDLEKLAGELGVGASVKFLNVSYEDIPKVYCSSLAVVLPSRYEGFSLVWLEAMASGRPMLSTPVGEAPKLFDEAYGKDAQRFLFRDEAELVQRLEALLGDREAYQGICGRAESIVKSEYSWENVASITRNIYLEASGKANH